MVTKKLGALLSIRWLGQLTDGIFQSALASFVLFSPERAPSAVDAAVAFAVVLLPYSIVGPYAGTFLDRFSRQRIVVFANALRAMNLLSLQMRSPLLVELLALSLVVELVLVLKIFWTALTPVISLVLF